MTEMLIKRTIDEMITHFNEVVSEMDIPQKDKMTLLGMITAIGYETQKNADALEAAELRIADLETALAACRVWRGAER